jgi:hypothetical protein
MWLRLRSRHDEQLDLEKKMTVILLKMMEKPHQNETIKMVLRSFFRNPKRNSLPRLPNQKKISLWRSDSVVLHPMFLWVHQIHLHLVPKTRAIYHPLISVEIWDLISVEISVQ